MTEQSHVSRRSSPERNSIDILELSARLDDPQLTIVDVRPLSAYNGWRLQGEVRGGHIPGAVAFPVAWLDSVDQPEIDRLLVGKQIVAGRDIAVSV
ncbi:MAG TPA: rhodanese-like domain-containing protein, partial [Candidatus Limnocylindrales bacterium]